MNAAGILLLTYLLVVLPWLAWRSAAQLRASRDDPVANPLPPLTSIFAGTLLMLVVLFLFAWLVGRTFDYHPLSFPAPDPRDLAAAAAALGAAFGLLWVSRAIRSPAKRRRAPVYKLLPRTRQEWALYLAVAVAAGIAEETAYRGVGMALLTWSTGSAWLSAALLSLAFGLAHITQEWKSVGLVVLMAALMHALVAVTGTLVIAMVVHAVYDIVAGLIGSREARSWESAPAGG